MQQKAWQDLTRKDLGFLNVLSSIFVNTENRDPNVISNVRSAECLFIGSDYGGQHSGSAYQTFAFLIADMNECAEWQNPREQIRRQNNLGRRRISFKDLNDSRRANALYDFLESTNMIGGMLIVFAIHKNSGSLFGIKKIVPADLEYDPLKKLSAPVAEKFMRVVTFLGFLIAGFSAPGQNILWVTDEDDIAANSNRVGHLAEALGLTMNQILSHKIQHLRVATAKQDKGDLSTEDLLAISDIAAGSICEYLTNAFERGAPPSGLLFLREPNKITKKTEAILNWFSDNTQPLKRMCILIDQIQETQKIRATRLRFHGSREYYC